MNTNEPLVSVVVVSYHTGAVLEECLTALLSEPEVKEIFLVDNGNDEEMRRRLAKMACQFPKLCLENPGRNLGFAVGCNLGARKAQGDYLAIVNPDLLVSPGTFAAILKSFAEKPDAWVCGARLLNLDGSEQRGGRREIATPWRALVELLRLDRLFPNHPHFRRLNQHEALPITSPTEVPTISGAFMVFPSERWRDLHGFDEGMFLHMEDVDICLRILRAGGKALFCGQAPVYHHLSSSNVPRIWVEWHKLRSGIYYFRKNFRDTYPVWALWGIALALTARFFLQIIYYAPAACQWLIKYRVRI
jgi:N-acetylglucosaminyl-diphospho-decaprenol L-rhamnosyltransferase